MINKQNKFDLVERTAQLGEKVIDFCKTISLTPITQSLIKQLIRSATSIGANYCEANEASSKKDYRNKIYIAKKEAKETLHWLRMIARAYPPCLDSSKELYGETHEILLIFVSIIRKVNI